jgi:hypothetical protein
MPVKSLSRLGVIGRSIAKARVILKEVLAALDRWTYTDLSIAPPGEDEFERLDLYYVTSGGAEALSRKRRDDALRAGANKVASNGSALTLGGYA